MVSFAPPVSRTRSVRERASRPGPYGRAEDASASEACEALAPPASPAAPSSRTSPAFQLKRFGVFAVMDRS